MNSKIFCGIAFAAGACVGAAVAGVYFKKKYETIADEEIECVKTAFREAKDETVKSVSEEKPDISTYKELAAKYKQEFEEASEIEESDEEDEDEGVTLEEVVRPTPTPVSRIYKLDPSDFGMIDDFDTLSFTHLEDGTVLDDDDDVVDNPESYFGDVEINLSADDVDSIYIRNEIKGADYEILYDPRNHQEYIKDTHRYHI